jgi:hypothetical protein
VFLESKMKRKGKKAGGDADAETALTAFAAGNQENALKTKPKVRCDTMSQQNIIADVHNRGTWLTTATSSC